MIPLTNVKLLDSFDTYWTVDNKKTYSKLEALIWANGESEKIQFHWMENTWDHVNFKKEPEESWANLCQARARQIRAQYDCVCLWYSGGYDSATMLQAFVDADCIVDEIGVLNWSHYYDDGEITECYRVIEWYRIHKNPKLKIRVAELDFDHVKSWWKDNPDWLCVPGNAVRFSRPHFGLRIDSVKEIKDLRFTESRADVMGFEKPRLDLYNNMWRTFMPDGTMANGAASGAVQFYCSHDMPALHIKQTHMAIQFFEQNNLTESKKIHTIQSHEPVNGYNWYPEWNYGVGRVRINNLQTALGTQKLSNPPTILAPMDQKLVHHARATDDVSFSIYMNGIKDLQQVLPWWDPLSTNFNKINLCSKFYNVRPVTY